MISLLDGAAVLGGTVRLGRKERQLLALLALATPSALAPADLVDSLWPTDAPRTADRTLHAYVSRLRAALRDVPGAEVTSGPGGYRLELAPGVLDLHLVEAALQRAEQLRASGDHGAAARVLADVEGLWGGPSLGDLATDPVLAPAAARLDDLRTTVAEERLLATVAAAEPSTPTGREALLDALAALGVLADAHPLRERLWAAQVAVLRALGRPDEAHAVAERGRQVLVEATGLDPVEALFAAPPARGLPIGMVPPLLGRRRRDRSFVGREGAVGALGAAWQQALAGHPVLAVVEGPPGVGKSRLVRELTASVAEVAVVLGGTNDEGLDAPYQPFVAALRWFVDAVPASELAGALGPGAAELRRLVPELGEALGGAVPTATQPEAARYLLVDALAAWLRAVAARAPVLFVVDDLHWAEPATLHALTHVLGHLAAARVLVVLTVRDGDGLTPPAAAFLAGLRRLPGPAREALRVRLDGLDLAATTALVSELSGRDPLLLAGVAAEVQRDSAGNPFFIEELVAHLGGGGPRAVDGGPTLPGSVGEVLGRRVAALPAGTRAVLEVAAVIGREVPVDVLARAVDGDVAAALAPAVAGGILAEHEVGRGGSYVFTHPLVPATIRERTGAVGVAVAHARLADAYEAAGVDDRAATSAEIARHHLGAVPVRGPAPAAVACLDASCAALERLAFDVAAELASAALGLLGGADPALELDLLLVLVEARFAAGVGDHRAPLERAWEIAGRLGDAGRAASAALAAVRGYATGFGVVDLGRVAALERALALVGPDASPVRSRLLATLAAELMWSPAERPRSRAMSDAALAMARLFGGPTLPTVMQLRLATLLEASEAPERDALSAEGAALAEAAGDPAGQVLFAVHALWAAVELGRPEQVRTCERLLRRLPPTLGLAQWAYTAGYPLMVLESLRGTPRSQRSEASAYAEYGRSLGLVEAPFMAFAEVAASHRWEDTYEEVVDDMEVWADLLPTMPVLRTWLVEMYARIGRHAEAAALLTDHVATGFELPEDHSHAIALAELALAATEIGDRVAAAALAERLEPLRGRCIRNPCNTIGPTDRVLARCAATAGDHDRADADFAGAIELSVRMGSGVWEAHCRADWAERLVARDPVAAGLQAAEAGRIATAYGLVGLTRRLTTVLHDAGAVPA